MYIFWGRSFDQRIWTKASFRPISWKGSLRSPRQPQGVCLSVLFAVSQVVQSMRRQNLWYEGCISPAGHGSTFGRDNHSVCQIRFRLDNQQAASAQVPEDVATLLSCLRSWTHRKSSQQWASSAFYVGLRSPQGPSVLHMWISSWRTCVLNDSPSFSWCRKTIATIWMQWIQSRTDELRL